MVNKNNIHGYIKAMKDSYVKNEVQDEKHRCY